MKKLLFSLLMLSGCQNVDWDKFNTAVQHMNNEYQRQDAINRESFYNAQTANAAAMSRNRQVIIDQRTATTYVAPYQQPLGVYGR